MAMALLYCQATKKEKAIALYNLFNENGWGSADHTHIAACDKEIKEFLGLLIRFSTVYVIEQTQMFGEDIGELIDKQGQITDTFSDAVDEWVDCVFGRKAKIPNQEFCDKVMSKEASWILYPEEIRLNIFKGAEVEYSPE